MPARAASHGPLPHFYIPYLALPAGPSRVHAYKYTRDSSSFLFFCRILVGAPLDQNAQPGTNRSGALWSCPMSTSSSDCVQIITDGRNSECDSCSLYSKTYMFKEYNIIFVEDIFRGRIHIPILHYRCRIDKIPAVFGTIVSSSSSPYMINYRRAGSFAGWRK